MRIAFANRCAWRAFYIYLDSGRKIAHLGIDPTADRGPTCFGSIAGFSWRFGLPHFKWKYPCSPIRMAAYRLSQRFYHGLDGRYGWKVK